MIRSERYQAMETHRVKRQLDERMAKLRHDWPFVREARQIQRARVDAAIKRINARGAK